MSALRDGDEKLHYSDNSHKWIAPPHIKQSAWDTAMKAHVELHRAAMGTPSRRTAPAGPGQFVAAPVGPGRPIRVDPVAAGACGTRAPLPAEPASGPARSLPAAGRPSGAVAGRVSAGAPGRGARTPLPASGRVSARTSSGPGAVPPLASGPGTATSGHRPGTATSGHRPGTATSGHRPGTATSGHGPGSVRAAGAAAPPTGTRSPAVPAQGVVPGTRRPGVLPARHTHGIVPAAVILARSLAEDGAVPPAGDRDAGASGAARGAVPARRPGGPARTGGARVTAAAAHEPPPRPARTPAVAAGRGSRTTRRAVDPAGLVARPDEPLLVRPAS